MINLADYDFSKFDDPKSYSYNEVQKIAYCQKCNLPLEGGDKFLIGREVGFMAVCKDCI